MQIVKITGSRWAELILGLLPVTVICGPLIPFTIVLMLVTLAFGAAFGVLDRKALLLFGSFVGSGIGLSGLWIGFLFDPADTRLRPLLFWYTTLSLLAGLAADVYFFHLTVLAPGLDRYSAFWILLLIGPFLLALKYLYLLWARDWKQS